MIRSLVAVLGGLVVTVALVILLTFLVSAWFATPAGLPISPAYLTLNLLGSAIAGALGGATAVKLAPHTPHGHVVALAILILLLSLPTLLAPPTAGQPEWYGLAVSVLGPVSVALGGLFTARARG